MTHPDKILIDQIRSMYQSQGNRFVTDGPAVDSAPMPKEYLDKMYELSNKYRPIRWLPLDIPRFEIGDVDEFKEIWDKQCHDVLRVKPDVAEPWSKEQHPLGKASSWHTSQFNGLHLYHHPQIPIETNTFAAKMYTGKVPLFERLVEQAMEYFPVHTATAIFIWESRAAIPPHRDRGWYWKCPTDWRAMLHDENTEPTLYVSDIEKGDTHFIDLPPDTNSFCWSNGTQVHGSVYKGKRKFLLAVSAYQHSVKTDDLISRSITKYRDKLNYNLDI
jgi:hypothetical protein